MTDRAGYRAALVEAIADLLRRRALSRGSINSSDVPYSSDAEAALAVVESAAPPCANPECEDGRVRTPGEHEAWEMAPCLACQGSGRSPQLYVDLMRGIEQVGWTCGAPRNGGRYITESLDRAAQWRILHENWPERRTAVEPVYVFRAASSEPTEGTDT